MEPIQMVDLKSQYIEIKEDIDRAIQEVLDASKFINGPVVSEFASELAAWNNTESVIPCANGTDGLQIAMMALGIKPGDEVIVPAFTYIATVEVIALLRLKPVFVDVEYDTFNIDTSKVNEAITERTRLIVPVHLYGQCANMEEIKKMAKKHDLFVIEDLAQALGATFDGIKAGNLSDIGVTSFFPSKNLGCYGDGGAILTNNQGLAERIRMIANHGQQKKYYHDIIGMNSRLDSIQAAVLKQKLKRLRQYELSRNEVATYYDEALGELPFLKIPARSSRSSHVFHQYTLKVEDKKRDLLKEYLRKKGIPSMIYYPLPVPDQKAYRQFGSTNYPISKRLSEVVISLPVHTHLNSGQLSYICDAIKKFQS